MDMIQSAETLIESQSNNPTPAITPTDFIPPMPPLPEITKRHQKNNLNFIPKEFT